ncbi:phosphomannose isomerase type II C-terminal cupin domain [Zhengella sp. ZM62]|uniref:phosphomannose isomerase type II C-terminal cupin domain n=1 Tax=Zhengella sedimenti TaxID=3390035 RepID=UPI00397709EE
MLEMFPKSDAKPVPVIMASNPLAGFWPRSTPERPWCFRRSGNTQSPVERLLEQFLEDPRFGAPILMVGELALRSATEQTASWRDRGMQVLVVPSDTRNGTAATLAILEIAMRRRRSRAVFIPASLQVEGGASPAGILAENAALMPPDKVAMIFTRHAGAADTGPAYVRGALFAGRMHHVQTILSSADGEARDTALAANDLHVPTGPVVCHSHGLIEALQQAAPMLLKSAASALQHADRSGALVRPHPGFLSLVASHGVTDLLAGHPNDLILNAAGEQMRTLGGWRDMEPAADDTLPPIRIGISGLPAHRVIQGPAGIFICAEGFEADAARFYPRPGSCDMPRSPGSALRIWGNEQLVEEEYGIRILRLEVSPGMSLPPECHLRRMETWSISSGHAMATIDHRIERMNAGDHVTIPAGAIHTLRNTGPEPLIVYECRIGAYLEDDDRIRTAKLRPLSTEIV